MVDPPKEGVISERTLLEDSVKPQRRFLDTSRRPPKLM
jgi:hypothetical protein